MRDLTRRFAVVALLPLLPLAQAACEEKDDGTEAGADTDVDTDTDADTDADGGSDTDPSCTPSTVADVCAAVFACGGWGWPDEATCDECFVNGSGNACAAYAGTECASEDGYLGCVCACVDLDCTPFSSCEGDCWTANCVG